VGFYLGCWFSPLYKCFFRRLSPRPVANSNAGSVRRAVPNAGYVFKVYQSLDLHRFNLCFASVACLQLLGVYTAFF